MDSEPGGAPQPLQSTASQVEEPAAPRQEPVASPPELDAPVPPAPVPSPAALRAGPGRVPPVVPFIVAGWLYGAAEGAFVASRGSRALTVASAAVLASILSAVLGLIVWLAVLAVRRIPWLHQLSARPSADTNAAAEPAERERLMRLYAHALTALALTAVAFAASTFVFPTLFDLQERDLARQLAVVAGCGMVAGSLVAVVVAGRAAFALFRAIDRRFRLPLPAPGWALCLLFVTLPVFAGLYPILRQYGGMLGFARDAGTTLLVACAGAQVWLVLRALAGRLASSSAPPSEARVPPSAAPRALPAKALTIASRAVVAAFALTVVALALLAQKRAADLASAESSPVASLGGRLARSLTDFDRDGVSSLFGGLDCAPFDPKRAPSRPEIPGNGIDEDCNGSDTVTVAAASHQERFSNALRPDQIRPYNVVWVIMETVRADHVSAIAYDKPTMPYLAKLAQESLLFTHAYAQSTATVLSVPSMLSGVDPGTAKWKKERGFLQLADSETLLAERLKKRKYKTGLVLDVYLKNNFLSAQRGFDDLLLAEPDAKKTNNRPRRNLFSTAKAAELLARIKPDDDFFMTVYYPDQHFPYTRHKDVDSSNFDATDLGDYDTELAFADQQLQALVEMLKARPAIWDNTILVINADHGEEFGEHGGSRHAVSCYNEVVHVPLLVRIPGIPAQRIDARVGLVDVVPTILELLDERTDLDRLSGQSLLLPVLRPALAAPDRPIFCNIASLTSKYGTFFRRAVRDGQYTLIQDFNEGRFALFSSSSDLFEHDDLSANPALTAQMQALKALLEASLTGNLRDHTKMGGQPDNPSEDPVDDPR
jgi:arylsulfatase A-like enzyme